MFGIGGFKLDFSTIAQLGLAAMTGGTSMLATTALRTIGSQIAMNLIQQFGQQMGLPQPMINLAQAAFANTSGQPGLVRQNIAEAVQGFVGQMDLRPSEAGQLQRELMDASDKSYQNMSKIIDQFNKRTLAGGEEGDEQGGSVLMKIARALGKLMDQKMDTLAAKADQLGRVGGEKGMKNKDGGFNAEGQSKFGQLSAEVQALSQEIGYLSQAISSSIKSIGEASATIARK
jgi:hypothetical protein